MTRITMAQGAGGEAMQVLISDLVLANFAQNQNNVEVPLEALDDSAIIDDIVFTTFQ